MTGLAPIDELDLTNKVIDSQRIKKTKKIQRFSRILRKGKNQTIRTITLQKPLGQNF